MLYLPSMEVNIWIGGISFQGFFKVSKTEERIFFRIWTLLDVEGCTLDQRIGSGGNNQGSLNLQKFEICVANYTEGDLTNGCVQYKGH